MMEFTTQEAAILLSSLIVSADEDMQDPEEAKVAMRCYDMPTMMGLGLKLLEESLDRARVPAFGVGGIDRENLATACAAGLQRAAVSSAICGSEDPAGEGAALLDILNR